MSGRPAARITDLHVCSLTPPPGLPIIPPCAINTLIGFLPAARITDLCACVGPPPANVDAIVTGSPTVYINGLMAARIGDLTAKGGVITTGQMNVLIGDAAVVVPPMPGMPGMPSPACVNLKQQADEIADAQDQAMLAAAAYGDEDSPLPENTRRATREDLEALGLYDPVTDTDMTRIEGSDFRADVFVHTDPSTMEDSYTVAFRGTTSGGDWRTNFEQGIGRDNAYYNQAGDIGVAASESAPGRVRFAGHSLGGGLASAAAASSGEPATTFNSAGLHPNTAERLGNREADVTAWHNTMDPLSRAQDTNDWMAPSAVGERRPLPPTTMWTPEERAMVGQHVDPDNWVPDRLERARGRVEAEGARQLRFHSMDEMQQILQNEADRIGAEQKQNGCL